MSNAIITGDKEAQDFLKKLDRSIQRTIAKKAMNDAIKPLKPAIKAEAPKQKGQLRKSIAVKVKAYSGSGVVFGIAGVRKDSVSTKTGARPSKYLHLVVRGVKKHEITPKTKTRMVFKLKRKRKFIFARTVNHPGFQGKDFMARTFSATKAQVEHRFATRVGHYVEGLK